jgi:hypothetical protein
MVKCCPTAMISRQHLSTFRTWIIEQWPSEASGGKSTTHHSFLLHLIFSSSVYAAMSVDSTLQFNPLTPNGLYSGWAVSPLKSRTAIKVAANRVSIFGGNLFSLFLTLIRFSAVVCYASGLRKVMLCFRTQNEPPPPPKPLINTDIVSDS